MTRHATLRSDSKQEADVVYLLHCRNTASQKELYSLVDMDANQVAHFISRIQTNNPPRFVSRTPFKPAPSWSGSRESGSVGGAGKAPDSQMRWRIDLHTREDAIHRPSLSAPHKWSDACLLSRLIASSETVIRTHTS